MDSNRPIVSVCIPTYNGGDRIKCCLDALLSAWHKRADVEIIVSDNCSNDNTKEILSSYKSKNGFSIFRNDKNLGFNGNFKRIVGEYAKGIYCWIIGDDDILDSDVLEKIIPILEKEKPSYVSVRHRLLKQQELELFHIQNERIVDYCISSYFKCLDLNASNSNVLGTFMSSQIFLLDRIKAFDLNSLGENDWRDFRRVFPNSYIMTTLFHDDDNCCCIKTPLITALVHDKSWDKKLNDVYTKILPDYYDYAKSLLKNRNDLVKTRNIIYRNLFYDSLVHFRNHRFSQIKWKRIVSMELLKTILNTILDKCNMMER